MSGARTSALAALRGQIERIETAEVVHHRDRVALGHREADSALKGGFRTRGNPRGILRRTSGRGRDGLCHRTCGARDGTQTAAVGAAGFFRN